MDAYCGLDGNIFVWDKTSGTQIRVMGDFWIKGMSKNVLLLSRVPALSIEVETNSHLVAACIENTVRVWNYETGKLVKSFGDENEKLSQLTPVDIKWEFDVNDTTKADERLREFLRAPPESQPEYWSNSNRIERLRRVRFNSKTGYLIASGGRATYIWDWHSERLLSELADARSCEMDLNGEEFYFQSLRRGIVRARIDNLREMASTSLFGDSVKLSPDGSALVVLDQGSINILDPKSLSFKARFPTTAESANSLYVCSNPRRFVTAAMDSNRGAIFLFDFGK